MTTPTDTMPDEFYARMALIQPPDHYEPDAYTELSEGLEPYIRKSLSAAREAALMACIAELANKSAALVKSALCGGTKFVGGTGFEMQESLERYSAIITEAQAQAKGGKDGQ